MLDTQKEIESDVLAVGLIDAVPTLLQVLCETTGMGFAAVARVSAGSWTVCAVRDDINLGLKPGSQLDLSTTLCCEMREARQAIVIDHVAEDIRYRDHQTPKLYGFQSYICVPIALANGDYFGNLCAIDPKPTRVSDPKTVSMFTRFAQLISHQLELKKIQESSHAALLDERAHGEMRELFVAILSHDLRKPLQAIDAAVDKLTLEAAAGGADIRAQTKRMGFLIDEVLDFSQARLGRGLTVRIEATDRTEQVLNATIEEIKAAHPQAKIISNIVVNRPIRCDLSRLQQLLTNLVGNALNYGSPQGPVSAVANISGGHLIIEVWNDGEPIAAQHMDKIFAPFWRHSSSSNREGVGLGLYLCAQIVKAHAGSIGVQSRKGEGTLFTATIPLSQIRA